MMPIRAAALASEKTTHAQPIPAAFFPRQPSPLRLRSFSDKLNLRVARFAACVGEQLHTQNCGFMYDAGITGSGSSA
jgi:hypothetical protein